MAASSGRRSPENVIRGSSTMRETKSRHASFFVMKPVASSS